MAFVTELVFFRARPGIAVETVSAVAAPDSCVSIEAEFGDIIRWRDQAGARIAGEAANGSPCTGGQEATGGPGAQACPLLCRSA
ncbi:MAG TPA: hypothetical protein VK597_05615 [Inquilinus sp.]|nr:hypothetical protein [Inquilinus sp.]